MYDSICCTARHEEGESCTMRRFELLEPTSLQEALSLLVEWEGRSKILAGGTDLLIELKEEKVTPEVLIGLRCVPGLSEIKKEADSLKIGAMATHRAIEKSPLVRLSFPALGDAVDNLGSIQVRNIATIGGNICSAAPSADTVPPLMVHGVTIKVYGSKGERVVPLDDFFEGPRKPRLGFTEILTEISLPLPSPRTYSAYTKLTRRSSMELPLLGVAALICFDLDGKILRGSIALACAGPTCFRAKAAEALFPGNRVEESFLRELGLAVLKESNPRESMRCSAQYRREMIPVLVARSVRQCYERCFEEKGRKG